METRTSAWEANWSAWRRSGCSGIGLTQAVGLKRVRHIKYGKALGWPARRRPGNSGIGLTQTAGLDKVRIVRYKLFQGRRAWRRSGYSGIGMFQAGRPGKGQTTEVQDIPRLTGLEKAKLPR
jgi:hypothetical protein